jgi:phosphoribosylanthranilate isomerase
MATLTRAMTWVKICAITNLPDGRASVAAGANALGFIFAPSTRRVQVRTAAEIIRELPAGIEKIGVFANQRPEHVGEIGAQVGLTGFQLHGAEPAAQLPKYRRLVGSCKLIKTLQVSELLMACGDRQLQTYLDVGSSIDAILLDSGVASNRGGTGVPFDWSAGFGIVQRIKPVLPVIIAGGLTSENVGEAIRLFAPWGVDVVSGVEREAGRKDEGKLRSFVAAVRAVNGAATEP